MHCFVATSCYRCAWRPCTCCHWVRPRTSQPCCPPCRQWGPSSTITCTASWSTSPQLKVKGFIECVCMMVVLMMDISRASNYLLLMLISVYLFLFTLFQHLLYQGIYCLNWWIFCRCQLLLPFTWGFCLSVSTSWGFGGFWDFVCQHWKVMLHRRICLSVSTSCNVGKLYASQEDFVCQCQLVVILLWMILGFCLSMTTSYYSSQ